MAKLRIGSYSIEIKQGDIWNIVLSDANFTLSSYIGYCTGSDAIVNVIASPTVYSVLRGDINIYINNKLITCTPYEHTDNGIYDFGLSTNNINLDCSSGGSFEVYSSHKWSVCDYTPNTLNVSKNGSVVTVKNTSNNRLLNGYVTICSNGIRQSVRVIQDTCDECKNGIFPSTEYLAFTETTKTINLTIVSQCNCNVYEEPSIITSNNVTTSKTGNYYSFTYNGTTPFSGTVATISNSCDNKTLNGSYTVSSDECADSTFTTTTTSYTFTKDNYLSAVEISAVSSTNIWRIASSDERLNCIKMGNRLYVSLKSYEDGTANVNLKDKCDNEINLQFIIPTGLTDSEDYKFYLASDCDYSSPSSALTALTSSGEEPPVYLLSTHLDNIYPWAVKSNDNKMKFTLFYKGNELENRIIEHSGGKKGECLQFVYCKTIDEVGSDDNKIYVVPNDNSLKKIINGYTAKIILQQDTTYNTVEIIYEFAKVEGSTNIKGIRAVSNQELSCSGGLIPKSSITVYATTETISPRGDVEETEEEITDFTITPEVYPLNNTDSSSSISVTVEYSGQTTTLSLPIGIGCNNTCFLTIKKEADEDSQFSSSITVNVSATTEIEGNVLYPDGKRYFYTIRGRVLDYNGNELEKATNWKCEKVDTLEDGTTADNSWYELTDCFVKPKENKTNNSKLGRFKVIWDKCNDVCYVNLIQHGVEEPTCTGTTSETYNWNDGCECIKTYTDACGDITTSVTSDDNCGTKPSECEEISILETIKANAYYGYEQQVKFGESNNYPINMKLNHDTNKWDISCNKIESANNQLISFDVNTSTQTTTLHVRVYFLLSDVNQYSDLKGLTRDNFIYNGNSIYQVTEYGTNTPAISGFYCYELSIVIGSLDNLSGRIAVLIETNNDSFNGTLLDVPINKSYS